MPISTHAVAAATVLALVGPPGLVGAAAPAGPCAGAAASSRAGGPGATATDPCGKRRGVITVPLVTGSGAAVDVATDAELTAALAAARPGDTIRMAAGTYRPLVIRGGGRPGAPVTLTGPRGAVVEGRGRKGYAVHLDGARHWQLTGFTVTGGGKGVMTDRSRFVVLDGLDVGDTGEEAVHFRAGSSDNVVQNSRIHDTGLRKPQFGEGVYLGSARSNWKRHSGGKPDRSMRNRVLANVFERITAENVDVKEETGGAVIAGNRFDGSAISGRNYADSVVDVKGYDTVVRDNVTRGSSPKLRNIIETHVITDPATSGCGNTIVGNTVEGFEPTGRLVAVDRKCG